MIIFRKPLSAYVAFARLFLILVPLMGITRLLLSLNGVPDHTARWFSMTALGMIGIVYFAIRMHSSGFGSYKQLLVVCTLQNLTAQAVSITGIILAIETNTNNIFSVPEFAFGSDGKTWFHVGQHLVLGTAGGSIVAWLIASLIFFSETKLSGSSGRSDS